jgi:N6-adenosine-specific RNA methylase IME4
MSKKFQVIVADPPWSFADSLKMSDVARGAEANYNTMTISKIKLMPVKEVSDPNGAILVLWVPSSLLQEGLDVMNAWGFKHKQTYIWVKNKKEPLLPLLKKFVKKVAEDGFKKTILSIANSFNLNDTLAFGMGRLFRQAHEIALVGINNKKIYKLLKNKSQRSVSLDVNLKHSRKPDHLQNSLEIMFPDTEKLEIFARRERDGWTCIGNEVCNGEDIYDSLAKFL